MEIIRTKIPATVAATHLSAYLAAARAGEREILLLLSGGSWFKSLDYVTDITDLSSRVTIGMLDERFSEDAAVNNFAQLMETKFYDRAKAAGVEFVDSRVQSGEAHTEYTVRLESALRDWHAAYPEGAIIVTLGMGEDGHTAGIFADSAALTSNEWLVATAVPAKVNPYPLRTTVTSHFLQTKVTAAIALVGGPDKCAQLEQVFDSETNVAEFPARLWHDMSAITVVTNCPLTT